MRHEHTASAATAYTVLRVERRKAKAMAAIAASCAQTMLEWPTPNADPEGAAPVVMHLADGRTPDTDVLYMNEPTQGSVQWYFVSDKQGKQIFSYDRGFPTPAGKLKAFVDAVQIQAIRE